MGFCKVSSRNDGEGSIRVLRSRTLCLIKIPLPSYLSTLWDHKRRVVTEFRDDRCKVIVRGTDGVHDEVVWVHTEPYTIDGETTRVCYLNPP